MISMGTCRWENGILSLCEKALQGFRDNGCIVDRATLDYSMEQLWQTWLTFRHWLVRSRALPLYQNPETRAQLKPELIWEIEGGENISGDQVAAASRARGLWYGALRQAFAQFDFLVLPTAQVFPFDAEIHWPKQIAGRSMDTYHRWMEIVVPGTLSGCPVVNVPVRIQRQGSADGTANYRQTLRRFRDPANGIRLRTGESLEPGQASANPFFVTDDLTPVAMYFSKYTI